MFLTCFSNKKSPAPFVYLLIQISCLTGLVYYCPAIINYKQYPEIVLFWLNVLITLTFYFNTHLRDPGYVPHDAIFFTDQEQPETSSGLKIRKRTDSLGVARSRAKKAAIRSKNLVVHDTFESKDIILDVNKGIIKGGRESPSNVTPNSTNHFFATAMGTDYCIEKKFDVEDIPSMLAGRVEENAAPLEEEEGEEGSKSSDKEENKQELELVDCEPSIGEEEDPSNANEFLDFNVKSKTDVEVVEEAGSPLKIRTSKSEGIGGLQQQGAKSSKREKRYEERQRDQRQEQEDSGLNQKAVSLNLEFVNIDNQEKKQTVSDEQLLTIQNTPVILKKKGKAASIGVKEKKYYAFNDEESIITHDNGTPQKKLPLLNLKHPNGRAFDNTQDGDATKSTEGTSTNKDIMKKAKHHRQNSMKDQSREIMLASPKLDELPEVDDMEKQEENKDDILYVERRYCTVCDVEQPLRAKHCKECKKCIAQYDHHCPWLGTCIGEKNHLPFYWFIIFQLIEILWSYFKVFEYMVTKEYRHWASENAGRLMLALILTFFLIMVISLFTFHTYLAIVNQTTWETLSWHKISYLKEWHEDWGSPFSEGTIKNVHFFCCTQKDSLKRWVMPKYKRPLNKQ